MRRLLDRPAKLPQGVGHLYGCQATAVKEIGRLAHLLPGIAEDTLELAGVRFVVGCEKGDRFARPARSSRSADAMDVV
jgi:hypothetical protein